MLVGLMIALSTVGVPMGPALAGVGVPVAPHPGAVDALLEIELLCGAHLGRAVLHGGDAEAAKAPAALVDHQIASNPTHPGTKITIGIA